MIPVPQKTNQLRHQLELALQTLRQTAGLEGRLVATKAREPQGHFADATIEFLAFVAFPYRGRSELDGRLEIVVLEG